MESNESPFLLMRGLETQLNGVLTAMDVYALPADERKTIMALRQELVDARLDTRDYELSETREQQLKNAKAAKSRIKKIQKAVLAASEYNVFGPADVAQLSAQLEHISDRLE
jgi:hypothetical protein